MGFLTVAPLRGCGLKQASPLAAPLVLTVAPLQGCGLKQASPLAAPSGLTVAPLLWLWTKVPYSVILYSSQHNGQPCLFADVGGGAVRELG